MHKGSEDGRSRGGGASSHNGVGGGRCETCGAEPWLWQVAEAGRRLIAHTAPYRAPATGRGEVVLQMMSDKDDKLFFSPLDLAFQELRAAICGSSAPVPAD